MLVRNGLIAPGQYRRPASSYIRWEREEPMELWQLDIIGGVFLSDGTEAKLVSGVVIMEVTRRSASGHVTYQA